MSEPQVFVVGHHQLFCEAVQSILRRAGIEPIGIVHDLRSAENSICLLSPDVIIVEQAEEQPDLAATAWSLVHPAAHARVISLSLKNNEVGIYDRRQGRILEGKDLVDLVTGT